MALWASGASVWGAEGVGQREGGGKRDQGVECGVAVVSLGFACRTVVAYAAIPCLRSPVRHVVKPVLSVHPEAHQSALTLPAICVIPCALAYRCTTRTPCPLPPLARCTPCPSNNPKAALAPCAP